MEPSVTVITPALNTEAFIGEAIGSVLAQTERSFEYLIVDNGSTDRTVEVASAKIGGTDAAKLIQTTKPGSAAARNHGLEVAQGDYIAFLDADDLWEPEMLTKSMAAMNRAGPDVKAVFCHSRLILAGGAIIGRLRPRPGLYDLEDLLAGGCPPGNGSCLLIRKACFDQVGGFDETMESAVDFEMWARIAAQSSGPSFMCFPEPLVRYRLHSYSVSGSLATRLGSQDRLACLGEILRRYADMIPTPEGRARAYVPPAVFSFRGGDDDKGIMWSRKGLELGLPSLLSYPFGRRMLIWLATGSAGRRAIRFVRSFFIDAAVRLMGLPVIPGIVRRLRG